MQLLNGYDIMMGLFRQVLGNYKGGQNSLGHFKKSLLSIYRCILVQFYCLYFLNIDKSLFFTKN